MDPTRRRCAGSVVLVDVLRGHEGQLLVAHSSSRVHAGFREAPQEREQVDDVPQHIWESASMPLTFGGLGVGGASRMCDAAHWSSWADCVEMVQNRHPHIAHAIGGLATRTPGIEGQFKNPGTD